MPQARILVVEHRGGLPRMNDEAPENCPTCKAGIDWSEWSPATVDESLLRDKAEIRIGRCRCSGKTFIQTRPRRKAPGEGAR
jgi:hypothetical protein